MATRRLPEPDIWSEPAAKAVAKLSQLQINFLAVDFDQTLISIHTGGGWKGTSAELAQFVRPMFQHLITQAMQADIHVAVVTFSAQTALVREVLELSLEGAASIPIRGADRSWLYNGKGCRNGKQPHMASAVEELEHVHPGLEISKKSTLLIDDDGKNVRLALTEGVRAVWLNPNKAHRLVKDLERLI